MEKLQREIGGIHEKCEVVVQVCDTMKEGYVEDLAEVTGVRLGRIDVVVCFLPFEPP